MNDKPPPTDDLAAQGAALRELTGWPAVTMTFCAQPPTGTPHIEKSAAAGCGYWRLALDGRSFYTEPADHFGCTVGAYTHGVDLPSAQQEELKSLIGTMVGLSYLKEEEVAQIPHRSDPLRYVVYAPLGQATLAPDVVIVRGRPRALMLLWEACRLGGLGDSVPVMGRPACSLVPQVLASGRAATSLGCIGNRVYTGLGDDEEYLALPGAALAAVMGGLGQVLRANETLRDFHEARRQAALAR